MPPRFRVGDIVRFTGVLPHSSTTNIGKEFPIEKIRINYTGWEYRLKGGPTGCREGNLELARPLTSFDKDLRAYLDSELK